MAFIHALSDLTTAGINAPADRDRPPGWIEQIPRPLGLNRRRLRFARMDRLAQLSLTTAAAALKAAVDNGASPPEDEEQAGAVLGSCFGAHLSNEQFQRGLMEEGQGGASPALFPYTLPSSAVGEVSIQLGLQGPLVTLARGPSSGLAALATASDLLDDGQARWMLAGAADTLGDTLLRAAGAGDEPQPMEEGAAFLVLTNEAAGALGRVSGWSCAAGPDALERAISQAGPQAPDTRKVCIDHGDGSASALHLQTHGDIMHGDAPRE